MPRFSALQVINEIGLPEVANDIVTTDQLSLTRRKLARLRANLKAIRYELSTKLLVEVKDCRESVIDTMDVIGELNATVQPENK